MKTRIVKHSGLRTLLVQSLVALLLFASIPLNAADKPEPKNAPAKQVAEPDASAAWQRRIPEFLSDNLPLGEIIRELRQRFPEINFLIKQQTETEIDVAA